MPVESADLNHRQRGETAHPVDGILVVSLEFNSESSAIAFEKYLKSGSGRAFAKKHFV
jgi:hypothetical protein